MRSTFHSLETAKRSIFTQQAAINTVGHNISNANTEGYSRQKVNMVAARPIEAYGMNRSNSAGQLGTGVEFTSITRIRNAFLDSQYRDQNHGVGSLSIQTDSLSKLEGYVNEPSDTGIRAVLENFWNSWSDLSKDPENVTGREILQENATALADTFNELNRQLTDLHADLTSNINVKVTEANSLLGTISSLNTEIRKIESLGDDANDLRDQRDLMTDKLSKIANINVSETDQGYNISMGNVNLVQGGTVTELTAAAVESAHANGTLVGGEMHGMIASRDNYVAGFQKQLDTLANTLANGEFQVTVPAGWVKPGTTTPTTADEVVTVKGINGLHKLGYSLTNPATAGEDFFTFKAGATGITAGSIQLNPTIASDANKIATSLRTSTDGAGVTTVIKGNNGLALLMSKLKDVKIAFDETANGGGITSATVSDFYGAVVGALGVQSQEAGRLHKNNQTQLDQVQASRLSVSGVSLDEEMADLIKYQYGYSASARFMTTFDQMLEKLINGTGVVGR
ncbi:flagellar hook-associated protein FlgK [Paenibacillus sp. L3-i20]|uniref:flagellar hook-associated protein FlgK n=1 Tax=Paenibacillus sp. L3-i20 TaxID=2905833 RepID=UPI001EDD1DE7|nr:flagellar hook-associated protein FlgK [Paenibacillus sp. L3-i20]GKU76825.1 flagellar hook-associated protein 1 [Paenibacillus sp. L3-i20]